MKKSVIVIGGGASGLTAAYAAAKNGAEVIIIEQNSELGKKILVTGNGRCNFTNTHMDSTAYYSDEESFVKFLLTTETSKNIIPFFEGIGMLVKETGGYCYPQTEQSITVREALSNQLKVLDVTIQLNEGVKNIIDEGAGFKVVSDKSTYHCDALIISTGGKSGVHSIKQLDGFTLINHTKHSITKLTPALVGMECHGKFFKKIAGVRTQATVTAVLDKKECGSATGELQLTNYGVSGIPVFQISRILSQGLLEKKVAEIYIDFMPHVEAKYLFEFLVRRKAKFEGMNVTAYMNGLLKDKLTQLLLYLCRIEGDDSVNELSSEVIEKMVRIIKKFSVTVINSKSFKESQVTAGGIPLSEIKQTFESKFHENLYITGEVLNVDGICGGYNLHFAWISGLIAGRESAEK